MCDIFLILLFHGKVSFSHKHRNFCITYVAFMFKICIPKVKDWLKPPDKKG